MREKGRKRKGKERERERKRDKERLLCYSRKTEHRVSLLTFLCRTLVGLSRLLSFLRRKGKERECGRLYITNDQCPSQMFPVRKKVLFFFMLLENRIRAIKYVIKKSTCDGRFPIEERVIQKVRPN